MDRPAAARHPADHEPPRSAFTVGVLRLRAFHHPDQALHAPQQYMRSGRLAPVRDLPARTEALLGALARHGLTPERPAPLGTAPALAVHTAAYLGFLETAWTRWEALPEHGPEVWPNTFPYWSGRPEAAARPPCPAEAIVGQAGWYLGDLSVPMGPHTWLSALRSSETAAAAADAVLGGAPSAYALCRPSGHHARTDRATGFCFLNNAAIAAERLLGRFGRVAVVDVDAHHGDGTQQVFYARADVLTVSVHADPAGYYPFFTGYPAETGHGAGEGFNLNLPLANGADGDAMAAALDAAAERVRAFGAGALVVALGFDAHRDDPIGVLDLGTEDFGEVGRRLRALDLPTLVVQEGGYALAAIGGCLDAFLDGFGRDA